METEEEVDKNLFQMVVKMWEEFFEKELNIKFSTKIKTEDIKFPEYLNDRNK